MDAGLRECLGDADLVVGGEDHAGLLLAVAEGRVVEPDLGGEVELSSDLRIVVPGTREPLSGVPGFACRVGRHDIPPSSACAVGYV